MYISDMSTKERTVQARVFESTMLKIKGEVARRRREKKYQPPMDTSCTIVRDAVNYYLDTSESNPPFDGWPVEKTNGKDLVHND